MITLDELNSLPCEQFVAAIGWVFEHSPWVAQRAGAQRPFRDLDELHRAMTEVVERATCEEQLALLRAHPDLGARARISPASAREQYSAGLDRLTEEEYRRLEKLNAAYRQKFRFPFIYAVKGSTKYGILRALDQRLKNTQREELRQALDQVYHIALFRLQDVIIQTAH